MPEDPSELEAGENQKDRRSEVLRGWESVEAIVLSVWEKRMQRCFEEKGEWVYRNWFRGETGAIQKH